VGTQEQQSTMRKPKREVKGLSCPASTTPNSLLSLCPWTQSLGKAAPAHFLEQCKQWCFLQQCQGRPPECSLGSLQSQSKEAECMTILWLRDNCTEQTLGTGIVSLRPAKLCSKVTLPEATALATLRTHQHHPQP
jgi:hypothetical protein